MASSSYTKDIREKMVKSMKDISKWDYAESEEGSAFEKRVANKIGNDLGATVMRYSGNKKKKMMKLPAGITVFVYPYGTQESPDAAVIGLKVCLNLKSMKKGWLPAFTIEVEIKRSKVGKIVWNSGFPKQNRIYMLNTKTKNKRGTTFVLGSDLVSEEHERKVENIKKSLKEAKKKYGDLGTFKVGHLRPMFVQDAYEANWLEHKEKEQREKNVYTFIRNWGAENDEKMEG